MFEKIFKIYDIIIPKRFSEVTQEDCLTAKQIQYDIEGSAKRVFKLTTS